MNPVKAMFDTIDQPFPKDTKAAGFLLMLTPVVIGDGGQALDITTIDALPITGRGALDAREITIADVPPGTYIGKIALVDANDVELAPAVVDPAPMVVVDTTPLTLPVPSSLSLTRP